MERRDFCGIIASPLLRKFVPPSPECGPAMLHSGEAIMPPLTVANLLAALDELKRQQDATGAPLTFPPGTKFQWAPWEPR